MMIRRERISKRVPSKVQCMVVTMVWERDGEGGGEVEPDDVTVL
jgi:hypothetical protein